ncbi:MAG: hypothetical protein LUO93_04140 [Methanomicrobiales archaeon]|nr:hypothetical protein [Methanomicrobiales archaeon]
MGFVDIVYEYLRDLRGEITDQEKRFHMARKAIKTAYYRYSIDWPTIRNAGMRSHYDHYLEAIFDQYANVFLDVATEVADLHPDQIRDLRAIASDLRRAAAICSMNIANALEIANTAQDFSEEKVQELLRQL